MALALGFDFGTSGARAIALDGAGALRAEAVCHFTGSAITDPERWKSALFDLLGQLPPEIRQQITAIALNGTSSTVLLCDGAGQPLAAPILYNDGRGATVLDHVRAIAPADHTVLSATSSLAKLLWWRRQGLTTGAKSIYLLHQADWLSFWLHGRLGISDYHNALKLGYDVAALAYPQWLTDALDTLMPGLRLPHVLAPGDPIGPLQGAIAQGFGLPPQCQIYAGTTDSIAAFWASGAERPGEAVTSLGSTLVVKLVSDRRVDDPRYGIYSHRLGDRWLVGGASNTGGAVLRHFFDDETLTLLSQQIDPHQDSGLDYYPLLAPGERFPHNDPRLLPRLTPRPVDDHRFLQGLLEGIARIEASAYERLSALGASPVQRVYTAGGGARNAVWTEMRSRYLGVPVRSSPHTEAAYGTACLAAGLVGAPEGAETRLDE